MQIFFTRHILEDSSRRIDKESKKKNTYKIKHYLRGLFMNLMQSETYNWHEIKKFRWEDWKMKIIANRHKFIYKSLWSNKYLLITYMRKTEIDELEGNLIYITWMYSKKKN